MLWTVPGNAVNAVVSIIMAFKIICEPFFKICFYWIVVELQYSCSCISFCCIAKWFSYIYVHSLIWLGHCTVTYLYFTFFFFLIFWPHHKDPSSPARESNPHTACIGNTVLTSGLPRKSRILLPYSFPLWFVTGYWIQSLCYAVRPVVYPFYS